MGLTKGYIFGASETVTNAKLHSLVDLGTVSGLVNAEVSATAGIVDTKLAQIATAQKVSATALTLLGSTPAAAGILPVANGGTGSATQNFVDLTTAQTVAGIKTFTSFPVTPSSAPTTDYQAANKKYVDDSEVGVDDSTIELDSGNLRVKDAGITYAKIQNSVYGDTTVHVNATTRSHTGTSYTKMKESTVVVPGTYNISFGLWISASVAQGKLYINGVAVGSEHSTASASEVTYTETNKTLAAGDLVQIYTKRTGNLATIYTANLTLKCQFFATTTSGY